MMRQVEKIVGMTATRDYHTKWSKSERERQMSYDITYMWNLKYGTNEPIYKRKRIHRHGNRLVVAKEEAGGEGRTGGLQLVDADYYI